MGWVWVLLPLVVWCVASVGLMGKDMYDHKKLKAKSKTGGATLEEEASRYAGKTYASKRPRDMLLKKSIRPLSLVASTD